MKRMTFLVLALVTTFSSLLAQRPSPEATSEGTIGAAKVKIVYSQPSARGRKVMGELVPFGAVWRTGANARTSFEISKPVKIEGKDLAAGKYSIFTIPGESEWTIIFNKDLKSSYSDYKKEDDVLRVNVKSTKISDFVETFNISVGKDEVQMKWENTAVAFKVKG